MNALGILFGIISPINILVLFHTTENVENMHFNALKLITTQAFIFHVWVKHESPLHRLYIRLAHSCLTSLYHKIPGPPHSHLN